MAHPRNPPIGLGAKISKNLLRKSNYSQFCPKFRCHGNGVGQGKIQLTAFDGPSPKLPPYRPRRKNLEKISYASRIIANFVPNFVAMATGVSRGKCNWQHSMAHPRKPPYRRKNLLRKPSYSPFCPKFRCHGNHGGSRVKLNDTVRFAIPENHTQNQKLRLYRIHSHVITLTR